MRTHGHAGSKPSGTYNSWRAMILRCTKPNRRDFQWYGKRGIQVCPQWYRFTAFLADMGVRPEGTSLDRIDVNGHYEPTNCRWATVQVQANNRQAQYDEELYGPMPDDWGIIAPKWPELIVQIPLADHRADEIPF